MLLLQVVRVQWSPSRPGVFFALDASSRLMIWDLLQDDQAPVVCERVLKRSNPVGSVFALSKRQGSVRLRPDSLIVGNAEGAAEVHNLSSDFTLPRDRELETLWSLLLTSNTSLPVHYRFAGKRDHRGGMHSDDDGK